MRGQYNGSDQNGAKIEMAWGADSVDVGHSWGDGAGRSMSANLSQVAAAVSSASNLLGEATQQVLQLCEETGKRVEEVTSELGALKEELRVHQQASEATITSLRESQQASEETIKSLKALRITSDNSRIGSRN